MSPDFFVPYVPDYSVVGLRRRSELAPASARKVSDEAFCKGYGAARESILQ